MAMNALSTAPVRVLEVVWQRRPLERHSQQMPESKEYRDPLQKPAVRDSTLGHGLKALLTGRTPWQCRAGSQDKWLEQFPQVTRAHEPGNRAKPLVACAGNDTPHYLLRNEGIPNGVAMIAKNQMTGPPTLPALSSITPDVTRENRNVKSQIPITKRPMK